MKFITLCADDYALNAAVSQGIIQLAAKGRLTAVSCLTNMPYWPEHAQWLAPYRTQLDIGLHFNLTEGQPLSGAGSLITKQGNFQPLAPLLLKAYAGMLQPAAIENELLRQLDAFTTHFKRLPNFIDGHQHVHHLPIIRQVLLQVYEQQLRPHHTYIRVANQRGGGLKPMIITATGALALRRQLQARGIPHNTTFAGSYAFAKAARYRRYFVNFLASVDDGGLIMCHPAVADNRAADPLNSSRAAEWAYLNSDDFQHDCAQHQISLQRLWSPN